MNLHSSMDRLETKKHYYGTELNSYLHSSMDRLETEELEKAIEAQDANLHSSMDRLETHY